MKTARPLEHTAPTLRDYQLETINTLRRRLHDNPSQNRLVVESATGSGKTVLAIHMAASAVRKGRNVLFIADRLTLIDQTARAFTGAGIRVGVMQGTRMFDASAPVWIASAQTLERRKTPIHHDLCIVDECHVQRTAVNEMLQGIDAPRVCIGLSATPITPGMDETWHGVVTTRTTIQLIEAGWLVQPTVLRGVSADMTGAKTSGGEFQQGDAGQRQSVIVGDVVETWLEKTTERYAGPVPTIAFSATVDHGQLLCEQFEEAGYAAEQISYLDRDRDERQRKVERFKSGQTTVLVSVAALSVGFDAPNARCLILARPLRKSLALLLQMLGRVLRPADGKQDALVLDHSDSCVRMWPDVCGFWQSGVGTLSASSPEPVPVEQQDDMACQECGALLTPGSRVCRECGKGRRIRIRTPDVVTGDFTELKFLKGASDAWLQFCAIATDSYRYHGDIDRARKHARVLYHDWCGLWPRRVFELRNDVAVSPELREAYNARVEAWKRNRQSG